MQASSAPSSVAPAAGFAIQYLGPNWEQQAVESAKNYLDMGDFSRSQLHQQLTSSAGERSTPSQADYTWLRTAFSSDSRPATTATPTAYAGT